MKDSLLYAKSMALLLEEVQSASDLTMVRSGLLRVRRFSRSYGLTLEIADGKMVVDSVCQTRPVPALARLTLAMVTHGVAQICISAGAMPSELLKAMVLLSQTRAMNNSSPGIFQELRDASLWSVQLYPVARTLSAEQSAAYAADVALDSVEQIEPRIATLTKAASAALAARDMSALAASLSTLAMVESGATRLELKALWTLGFEQAATADALRALVAALPTCGDAISNATAVLKRAGDAGADVLIDQLLKSDSMDVRRACFDALAEVRRGTAQLLTMLTHEQWFVVRNAACLLGAFHSRSSEPELTATLTHADERVRAAAVTALLQLDTPTSRATVRTAIRDASPEVRRRAVRGFLAEPGSTANADKLLLALERETELDVQLEFLYALGTLATPDAVQKLIRLCSMDGRYRPADFRIAAAEALASARLGAAVPLLRAMLKDPDVHARAAARHLIRAVS
jgi:HEAT repeat protein